MLFRLARSNSSPWKTWRRLTLDLSNEIPTPFKHAKHFLRLAALVDPEDVETAWLDHRKPEHSVSFKRKGRGCMPPDKEGTH
jgi:hypothetical protein